MLILVTGGAASGKSAHAERLLCERTQDRLYVATMPPFGAVAEQRIARHRALRAGKGFQTAERYTDLAGFCPARRYDGALVEDVPNLLAGETFSPAGAGKAGAGEAVLRGIFALGRQVDTLVVVTGEVFSDGVTYGADTTRYLHTLGEINRALAAHADVFYESVCGILVQMKGENAV